MYSYIKTSEAIIYDDLFMDFSGEYIFIRYSPDKFIDKYGKCKNPFFENQIHVLIGVFCFHIYTDIQTATFTI